MHSRLTLPIHQQVFIMRKFKSNINHKQLETLFYFSNFEIEWMNEWKANFIRVYYNWFITWNFVNAVPLYTIENHINLYMCAQIHFLHLICAEKKQKDYKYAIDDRQFFFRTIIHVRINFSTTIDPTRNF